MSTSYSSSIVHSDDKNSNKDNQAQSSVNVNFHNSEAQSILLPHSATVHQGVHNFSPPDFVRDNQESQAPNPINEIYYETLKQHQQPSQHQKQQSQEPEPLENVYHTLPQQSSPILEGAKQQNHPGSYLAALATKQYLNINPLQLQYQTPAPKSSFDGHSLLDAIRQPSNSQQQLYNVGYSINIENNSPKLMYRVPNPPNRNAHSYRQQKLLNGDVITGVNKIKVEKPFGFSQNHQDTNLPATTNNYIVLDHGKRNQFASPSIPEKPLNKVYSDVKNTHGYTWKNLSPNVEISGYHSLNNKQNSQSQTFDHAGALGRSQGFDISNVVENGKQAYKKQHSPSGESHQAFDINKELSSGSQITPDIGDISEGPGDSQIDYFKFPSSSTFNFGGLKSSHGTELLNYQATPFQQNLLSPGTSNIEFDKSLLDGFYKNYNPNFYQSEITIPSPTLPQNINVNLHSAASNRVPTYNVKIAEYTGPHNSNPPLSDPQVMVNQHYAFAQAESLKEQPTAQPYTQLLAASDVKPVREPQEEIHSQQSQTQLITVQKPTIQQESKSKYSVGVEQHMKSFVHSQTHPIPFRQGFSSTGGRPVTYDKNFKLKTGLRPPPMYVIHQKY